MNQSEKVEMPSLVSQTPTCNCAFCDWVRRNGKHVVEPQPGHTYNDKHNNRG